MGQKFNKTASKDVIAELRELLNEYRADVRNSSTKDIEEKIKDTKNRIKSVNGLIEEQRKLNNGVASFVMTFLLDERRVAEEKLEMFREDFKRESEDIHYTKEMIRHLEHAIATLKKEFNQ